MQPLPRKEIGVIPRQVSEMSPVTHQKFSSFKLCLIWLRGMRFDRFPVSLFVNKWSFINMFIEVRFRRKKGPFLS